MDLSSLFGGVNGGFFGAVPAMTDFGGNIASLFNNSNTNTQVQQGLGQNSQALQSQLQTLQQQQAQAHQQAQDQYQAALANVNAANPQLQGNISTQTANLNALSDPNSPYMQMARQAIERKDAAAGRNSQWGDRETQLAGTLADYVGKYSPGIQQSITSAQDQISRNNANLASLYNTANMPADRDIAAQIAAVQQQIANSNAANTTGRQSQASQTNALLGSIKSGAGLLGSLFGGGGSSYPGISSIFQGNNTPLWGADWSNPASVLDYGQTQMPGSIFTGNPDFGANYSTGSNPFGYTSSIGSSSNPWDLLND